MVGSLVLTGIFVFLSLTLTHTQKIVKTIYDLQVMESHQASKLDTSGTAKAVISCFQKLGVSFELDQVYLQQRCD